jgi:polyhydroxybutyrate depolymerase
MVDGLERTYLVHVPRGYDGKRALPLVLGLHGGGGQGRSMNNLAGWNKASDEHGFLIAYPDGVRRRWNDGRQSGRLDSPSVDDVKFLSALVEKLSAEYRVDPKRVYSTGISNGGFMSQRLACDLSDRIAAIGVVAATMGEQLSRRCKPAKPVSVLILQGTEDPLVPYQGGRVNVRGGGAIISATAARDIWVKLDGCRGGIEKSELPDSSEDGTRTHVERWRGCRNSTEVALYTIEGGGHTWPGGRQYLPERIIGRTAREFHATEVIWEFFEKHPMR